MEESGLMKLIELIGWIREIEFKEKSELMNYYIQGICIVPALVNCKIGGDSAAKNGKEGLVGL